MHLHCRAAKERKMRGLGLDTEIMKDWVDVKEHHLIYHVMGIYGLYSWIHNTGLRVQGLGFKVTKGWVYGK